MKVSASDKREYERHALDIPIMYAYHNTDMFFNATMCNYCKNGMCFESADAVKPGEDIYIMLEDFSSEAIGTELYEGYLAEVRWCSKPSKPQVGMFKIGVKYYQTVIK